MPTLTLRDESAAGTVHGSFELTDLDDRITVRELIRSRVYQEVRDLEVRQAASDRDLLDFRGLVTPSDTERALNGPGIRVPKGRKINWKEQYENACEAFKRNGFLILINDRQAESLDEEFDVGPSTDVAFLKLTPLVGG